MSEDVTALMRQLDARAAGIRSFSADYRVEYRSGVMPFTVEGRMSFLRPDKARAEATVNGKPLVAVRNGSRVRRFAPGGGEAWEYDLKEIPLRAPLNAGLDDLSGPFAAVEPGTLRYEGIEEAGGARGHVFVGMMRRVEAEGLMDTRKGFSLRYEQKVPATRLRMRIDPDTGLLLAMAGIDEAGEPAFQKTFSLREVNGPMDESLFRMEEPPPGLRVVRVTDLMIHAMDPDFADRPPSMN
jgi:hypothetical protein